MAPRRLVVEWGPAGSVNTAQFQGRNRGEKKVLAVTYSSTGNMIFAGTSAGEVIAWDFENLVPPGGRRVARHMLHKRLK